MTQVLSIHLAPVSRVSLVFFLLSRSIMRQETIKTTKIKLRKKVPIISLKLTRMITTSTVD